MAYDFSEVISRAQDHSPYLNECIIQFPDIIAQFKSGHSPQEILSQYRKTYLGNISDFETEMSHLRVFKKAVHLICALADLARVWSWVEVTQALSDVADVALKVMMRTLFQGFSLLQWVSMGQVNSIIQAILILRSFMIPNISCCRI